MCTNTKYKKGVHKYEIHTICAQMRNTQSMCTNTKYKEYVDKYEMQKTLMVVLGKLQCYFFGVGGILVFIFMAQNTKLHHFDHYKWDQALHRNSLYYRVCAATFKLTVPKL